MFQKIVQQSQSLRPNKIPLIGNGHKEFVPVLSMNQPILRSRRNPGGDLNTFLENQKNPYRDKGLKVPPIIELVTSKTFEINTNEHGGAGIRHFEELEVLCKEAFPNAIKDYFERGVQYEAGLPSSSNSDYGGLMSSLELNKWSFTRLQSGHYLTNLHCCMETRYHNSDYPNEFIPLFVLVTKPEFIDYLRMCWLTGDTPEPSIFELWVHPEFDVKNSHWKHLRTRYRKTYKPIIEGAGISIVEVPNILERLFFKIRVPEDIKSIKGRKEWVQGVSRETMQHLKLANGLESSNIKLKM